MEGKPGELLIPASESRMPTENLTVVAEATAIYEGGHLIQVTIAELVHNEVALRQLINNLNLTNRENEQLKTDLHNVKIQLASYTLQPAISVILAVVSLCGAVLIGLATNYLSGDKPPSASVLLLVVGCILTLIGAIGNIVLAAVIRYFRGKI